MSIFFRLRHFEDTGSDVACSAANIDCSATFYEQTSLVSCADCAVTVSRLFLTMDTYSLASLADDTIAKTNLLFTICFQYCFKHRLKLSK